MKILNEGLTPLSHVEPEAKGKICAPVCMFLYILLVFYIFSAKDYSWGNIEN